MINQSQFVAHVRKYYPPEAASVLVKTNSEYNDEDYDNRVKCIVVYNTAGEELVPIPATADESRNEWDRFEIADDRTDEPLEDFKIQLDQPGK